MKNPNVPKTTAVPKNPATPKPQGLPKLVQGFSINLSGWSAVAAVLGALTIVVGGVGYIVKILIDNGYQILDLNGLSITNRSGSEPEEEPGASASGFYGLFAA